MDYSAGRITSWAWAQPNYAPIYKPAPGGMGVSTGLGDPHFAITVEWDWPEGDWTHFNIVRTIRSPARRFEEGQAMLSADYEGSVLCLKANHPTATVDGRPYFTDPQPPPGEWVYYTIFCLAPNRVWQPAGSVLEIGPADHDWTLRLPEFLPGASTTVRNGVAHPADQETTLTQFLQGPGTYMDTAATMAEAVQYFWSPRQCPPASLEHLALSWGYKYSDSLGAGRTREVLYALKMPSQGSLTAIQGIASGAMGCESVVLMSNNMMLNTSDSSFETGDITDTAWGPDTALSGLELWDYVGHTDPDQYPKPIAPPNVSYKYHLYIPSGRTLWCGYAPDNRVQPDPIRYGVPVAGWKKMRMGCYAYDRRNTPTEVRTNMTLGMDLYDINGFYIQTQTVLPQRDLTTFVWEWHGNGDAISPEHATDIVVPAVEEAPTDVLTNITHWDDSVQPGHANPQPAPVAVAEGMALTWSATPTTYGDRAFQGVVNFQSDALTETWRYRIKIKVKATPKSGSTQPPASWRVAVIGGDYSETISPAHDVNGSEMEVELEWMCRNQNLTPHIGVEVIVPATGWTDAGTHVVTGFSVIRQPVAPAYGVPWITVSDACCIDLLVVDDG